MEMEEMCRVGNKMGLGGGGGGGRRGGEQYQDEDEEEGEERKVAESNRLRAWHSSRIFRVSRASGGKDRHSKVLTAKGLRDRRVRLSVSTAIQFYDLQDRLGYDQPSKAVEWLIKAAADAIAELPSLDTKFPEPPSDDEKRASMSASRALVDFENDPAFQQHPQHTACSSTSETSKGSVLSLNRSEIRVKARERARERAAKDKDKEQQMDESHGGSQNSSFTELLTGGGAGKNHSPNQSAPQNHNSPFFLKQAPPPTSMEYFPPGLFGQAGQAGSSRSQFPSGFGFSTPIQTMPPYPHHQSELQQFSFLPDHLTPDAPTGISDYDLNFSISSGLAGYNRGTLQSNSPSPLPPPHLQRFPSPADGSNIPFYSNASTTQNQFFDGRLHLYYGDGSRHSDSKGKEKP